MEETNQLADLNSELVAQVISSPEPEIKKHPNLGGARPGAGRPRKPKPKGGAREGAGRPRNPWKLLNRPSVEIARAIYEESNPREVFHKLLRSKSDDVRLRTITFLHEQAFGKAKQAVDISGGIVHAHTVYRNPQLAALSLEELQALDDITKKLALPAPDGPQNHTKSDTETNAIDVECEAIETVQAPQNASNSEIESPANE